MDSQVRTPEAAALHSSLIKFLTSFSTQVRMEIFCETLRDLIVLQGSLHEP